jgi:hypothetical protein
MKELVVAVSGGKSGTFHIFFDEEDVRNACRKMPCGDGSDACLRLMEERNVCCALCYAVLTALKKRPVSVRRQ